MLTGAQAMINTINISSIEVVNVRSVRDVGATGGATNRKRFQPCTNLAATTVNVTQGTANVFLAANAASDINVTSVAVTGSIQLDGGDAVTVITDDATTGVVIGGVRLVRREQLTSRILMHQLAP